MRHVKLIESILDMARLGDDAPDVGYGDLRGGVPVETPQERDVSGGVQGGVQGVSKGVPGGVQGGVQGCPEGSEGVSTAPKGVSRGWPWYKKGVPQTDLSPLWWAKATRIVRWKGDKPLRLFLWWGGVVVTLFLAGGPLLPAGAVPLAMVAMAFLFFLLDPFEVLSRRVAMQSRLLILGASLFIAFAVASPSIGSIAVAVLAAALAALMVVTCNTEWVVTMNYISSPAIHAAMANDPTGSAHQSWNGVGARIAYTYSSEMGYPPTSNYIWALLRGVYIIGWVLGVRRIVSDDECAAAEDMPDRVAELQGAVDELSRALAKSEEECRGLREQLQGTDNGRYVQDLERELEEAREKAGVDRWLIAKLREDNMKLAEEGELKLAEEKKRHEDALASAEARFTAEADRKSAAYEAAAREAENALLADANGIRERFLREEIAHGTTSAKKLSEITGIPRTSVMRILERWRAEEDAAGGKEGTAA